MHLNDSMGESKMCVGEGHSPVKKQNSPAGELDFHAGGLNPPMGEQNYGVGEVDFFAEEESHGREELDSP